MNQQINYLSPSIFPYTWSGEWGEDKYGLWQMLHLPQKPLGKFRAGIDPYGGVQYIFRWIPPGSFLMGSPAGTVDDLRVGDPVTGELSRNDNEDRHQVAISNGFWLGETPVTQTFWDEFMEENPSQFNDEHHPIENISWNNARAFIEKLSNYHPELNVRLPWEAEWEYACRAWTQGMFSFDEKDKLSLQHANYSGEWNTGEFTENAKKQTTKVKSYPCNQWGLYEMHGNVWEWCEDLWEEYLTDHTISASSGSRKVIQNNGMKYVVRGGSWKSPGKDLRSASRRPYDGDFSSDDIGFRLALSDRPS